MWKALGAACSTKARYIIASVIFITTGAAVASYCFIFRGTDVSTTTDETAATTTMTTAIPTSMETSLSPTTMTTSIPPTTMTKMTTSLSPTTITTFLLPTPMTTTLPLTTITTPLPPSTTTKTTLLPSTTLTTRPTTTSTLPPVTNCDGVCAFSSQCESRSGNKNCRCTRATCKMFSSRDAPMTSFDHFDEFIKAYSR